MFIKYRVLQSLVAVAVSWAGVAHAACSQEDALNRMLAVSDGLTKLQTENAIATDKLLAANEKLNKGGEALATGNFDEACRLYDEIATENGIAIAP